MLKVKKILTNIEVGLEYYTPIHNNRQIKTISADFLYGWESLKKTPFTFNFGGTITYAWGEITQLNQNFKEIVYQNKAAGIGPIFLVRIEPFVYQKFSFSPNFKGRILLYSKKFPFGGDIYNFMWRFGGAIH